MVPISGFAFIRHRHVAAGSLRTAILCERDASILSNIILTHTEVRPSGGQPQQTANDEKRLRGSAREHSVSDRNTALWDDGVRHLCAGISGKAGDWNRTVG